MDESTKAVVEKYRRQLAPLEEQIAPLLAQVNKLKDRINGLFELEGEQIPYPEATTASTLPDSRLSKPLVTRADQYFGQPLATVVKEILEWRSGENLGAISLEELYDLMKQGGYAFEGKDDATKKRILASALGKNPAFARVPNSGHIGLAEWYPTARRGRPRNGMVTITAPDGRTIEQPFDEPPNQFSPFMGTEQKVGNEKPQNQE